MTVEEYFGDWLKVIDKASLDKVVSALNHIYKTSDVTPAYNNCPF